MKYEELCRYLFVYFIIFSENMFSSSQFNQSWITSSLGELFCYSYLYMTRQYVMYPFACKQTLTSLLIQCTGQQREEVTRTCFYFICHQRPSCKYMGEWHALSGIFSTPRKLLLLTLVSHLHFCTNNCFFSCLDFLYSFQLSQHSCSHQKLLHSMVVHC